MGLRSIHGEGLAGVGKSREKMAVHRIPERRRVGAQVRGEAGEIPDSHASTISRGPGGAGWVGWAVLAGVAGQR